MHKKPYKTRLSNITIPNTKNLVIRSLLDHQQYHDPKGEAEQLGISPALWPLFGLLWPSAIHLAGHIALRPVCSNEKILEIGCGLALASQVAHRRGARITASDRHPLAEAFLYENLYLNRLSPSLKYRHGQWGLDTSPTDEEVGRPVLSGQYDLIIGSDLLYERGAASALAHFIHQHALPESEVWIVDANRGYRPALNRQMSEYGFGLSDDIRLDDGPFRRDKQPYKGRLLKYHRPSR